MKIGILTYHRSHNYGAMLQAYALKTYTGRNSQNDVGFIDYYPPYFHDDKLIDPATLRNLSVRGGIKYIAASLFNHGKIRLRKDAYYSFLNNYLAPLFPVSEKFDLVIYGSDQIWRYQNRDSFQGFSDVYWGYTLINAERKITFAASVGAIPQGQEYDEYCKMAINNFEAVSVRESDLKDYLLMLSPTKNIKQHLDPVFLLNKDQWSKVQGRKTIKTKYILVYNLQGLEAVEKMASQLNKKTDLPVINLKASISNIFTKDNEIYDAGPDDFVSLIRDAEYVVTSSFHGVAFSVLLNVPFYCCAESAPQRLASMLTALGLQNRMVTDINNVEYDVIDWVSINEKITDMVSESKSYLQTYIANE